MATLRDIKRRIKSVKSTRQITKAMKMVSAAKLRKAQEDIFSLRPYADKIKEVMASLSKNVPPEANPLLSKPSTGKVELIVITSDRGLCGGFNTQLIRTAERFVREKKDLNISLNIIGRRAADYYKNRALPIIQTRSFGLARPNYKTASAIAQDIINGYLKDRSDEVYIVYSEFKSVLTQRPLVERILPIAPPHDKDTGGMMEGGYEGSLFEPSKQYILEKLLPKYVETRIFKALLESRASEHGARMTAMDSASKNASEMIDYLTLKFNRARQSAITKELMEIIGGAEALK